ncbi:protein of unknown function [Methylotuvimicrobium alcaliphilum 20Z]|uniref:Uncharacterized protein n=1 Tax=Methylotuvimicrobium alcaliphilum (strain DSM 19304 / NCIMB 14124 / VKM B-2133 / 20Z) TaxID=1091494 RepID=G4T3P7_META2|nr:protein of unknown function [Methylotuvimicrobium alcaliphilum 20Z]
MVNKGKSSFLAGTHCRPIISIVNLILENPSIYSVSQGSSLVVIPFALQISAVPEEAPGCPVDFRSCKIDIHTIHGAHKGFASMELA